MPAMHRPPSLPLWPLHLMFALMPLWWAVGDVLRDRAGHGRDRRPGQPDSPASAGNDGTLRAMKFLLEVDLAQFDRDAAQELGRILRHWGGAMDEVELADGANQQIYDSRYRHVGHWLITEEPDS
jgi:hypothetical protein